MTRLTRFRDWWMGQFRSTGRLGKLALVLVPLLFVCCGLSMCSLIISPPEAATPTAEVAERAATAALDEVVEATAVANETAGPVTEQATVTDEPVATDEPTATPRPTTRPTNTARPTAAPTDTVEPTRPATVGAATALFATAAASEPTAAPVTATNLPAPTVAPTSVPPTAAPTVAPPTVAPPTAIPATAAPLPTATLPPPAAPGDVIISTIRYDGDVPNVESDEYAVIMNRGGAVVNIGGWRLNAGEPDQNFTFPSFDLQPGQSCRVYTNEVHPESCGFTFGRGDAIWRNSNDCGYLFNADGAEVSRFCWS